MIVSFGEAQRVASGVWVGSIAADEVRVLPGAPLQGHGRHVVLVQQPTYDQERQTLHAKLADIKVLLAGSSAEAIFIQQEVGDGMAATPPAAKSGLAPSSSLRSARTTLEPPHANPVARFGPGDYGFIQSLDSFDPGLARLGRMLLERVRQMRDGDLKQTENPRKFIESPDNLWAIETQTRLHTLKVIVRARHPDRLRSAGLDIKSERPPLYWYLKLAADADLEPALKMISLADPH